MERAEGGEHEMELLPPDVIRVLKDSEDRAHGTPKQSVEHGGNPENPVRHVIERRIVRPGDKG